ncbi:HEPN domain-containing protein [Geothermobacter ehrlichii]|nr:HEPN domain-containing protein [Geothermobacter ehrlichii]
MSEVARLMDIHTIVAGAGPGRKRDVQVLNKSAIIITLACWEAYVEDLARNAFEYMLNVASEPSIFPDHVLAVAGKRIAKAGALDVWMLADDGWKAALSAHKDEILNKYIVKGSFNTPSCKNIDKLYSELIGLTSASREFYWPGMSNDKAKKKLQDLIDLRGEIAHRVESSKSVYKKDVEGYQKFIKRLAVILHNRTIALIYARTKTMPWRLYRHGKIH